MTSSQSYPFLWRVRARLPERFGQRCRVLVRSRTMNSCLVTIFERRGLMSNLLEPEVWPNPEDPDPQEPLPWWLAVVILVVLLGGLMLLPALTGVDR